MLFLISFPLLHFLFLFNNLFHFIFVLCRRLQCGHSCQCFVSTLISFLIHFPLLHFLFIFFYSITLFYITFVAVLTTAMSILMPIFCFNLNFIFDFTFNLFSVASFSICIFLLNNFIFFIFVLC